MTTENADMNGVDLGAVAEVLQEEVTVGYRPQVPAEALWASGAGGTDMPQITLRRDIEFMQFHPIISIALEYYKSGIAGAEFWGGPDHANPTNEMGKPISPDARVCEFVMAHCVRFWQRGLPLLQEGGYPYGWAPGEHIYKDVNGMLCWSHLKAFHPNDGFILTAQNQPVGVRVKGVRGKQPVDLHFASESIPAKGCWYSHRPRFGSFYGRSQLTGAWLPWRMLGWRDGMDQVINAAVYRAGYSGPVGRYPPGNTAPTAQQGVPSTRVDGNGLPRRENRDIMRQFMEYAKAGASFALSSETYPTSQGGGLKWDVQWPEHVMDVRPLIDAAGWAEDRIMLGIGVPPELVKAGGTGSGYSGRSIPREAFLDGQQKVADAILQMFVEQVLKPLVLWNFGDVPFEVSCKSLLKSQADDKQGDDQAQGADGQPPQPAQPNPAQPPQPAPAGQQPVPPNQAQPQPALSMDPAVRERILSIVQRVLRGKVA